MRRSRSATPTTASTTSREAKSSASRRSAPQRQGRSPSSRASGHHLERRLAGMKDASAKAPASRSWRFRHPRKTRSAAPSSSQPAPPGTPIWPRGCPRAAGRVHRMPRGHRPPKTKLIASHDPAGAGSAPRRQTTCSSPEVFSAGQRIVKLLTTSTGKMPSSPIIYSGADLVTERRRRLHREVEKMESGG